MFYLTFLAFVTVWNIVQLNKQPDYITICPNRNSNCKTMHKTVDDLRVMEADNIIEGSWRRLSHIGWHHL
jgi:hypothetical protein